MARRRTARRLRQAVVASGAAVLLALLVRPVRTAVPASSAVSPSAAPVSASAATALDDSGPALFQALPASSKGRKGAAGKAAASVWRRPGDLLKRGKTGEAVPLAIAVDPRLRERHESLNRWHHIYSYSAKYRIKPDLARRIYDAAITAGLEPELGFRLVRVESVFDTKAVSPVGALGLTQLMPSTARLFEPAVTDEQLLTADVNLRIGFRYLRTLIRENKGDLKLALLVYNRGPVAVERALAMGRNPANGYESMVTKGYRGRGTLD